MGLAFVVIVGQNIGAGDKEGAVSCVLIHIMQLGILGVWIGMFADWYVRGFCYSARFLSKRWLNMKAI